MRRTEENPVGSSTAGRSGHDPVSTSQQPTRLGRDPAKYELSVGAVALVLGVAGQLLHSNSMLYVGATFAAIAFGMLLFRVLSADRN